MRETVSGTLNRIASGASEALGTPDDGRSPAPVRVCVLGYRQLNDLIASVAHEFDGLVELQIVDVGTDSVLEEARARERSGRIDAFMSAGANAATLQGAVATPVAVIEVTGYDLLHALLRASEIASRVAVVTYGETIPELDSIHGVLNIAVAQRSYLSVNEARSAVSELGQQGCGVFVGPSMVVELAEQLGYRGVLAYSLRSVRRGIEAALHRVNAAHQASSRYRHLRGVLNGLSEPVIAVDERGCVTMLNEAMEALLGPLHRLQGRPLSSVVPGLRERNVVGPERDLGEVALPDRSVPLRASCRPMRERERIVGALVTFRERSAARTATRGLFNGSAARSSVARHVFDDLIGSSPAFLRARDVARRYARTDSTILLTGETGTGKELFAQSIHNEGPRAGGPFMAVNCGAFPESLLESLLFGYEEGAFTGSRRGGQRGLFEAAHGGTLFLDEIGDMPTTLQTRLLRVIQEREVLRVGATAPVAIDVRIIAATHRDLQALVRRRRFRADLHYRLDVLSVTLPPLRERREDIERLVLEATSRGLARLGCAIDAARALEPLMPRLKRHAWPGNIRELENVCERLAVHLWHFEGVSRIDYAQLERDCGPPIARSPRGAGAGALEDDAVRWALQAARGHRNDAAHRLGISRSTLWRRMKALEKTG